MKVATDLLLVARADLVVGSAANMAGLSLLCVFSNISSSALSQVQLQRIDTADDLIVKGNADYFSNPVSRTFSLELEDLIIVHLMEVGNTIYNFLQGLLFAGTSTDRPKSQS